MMFWPVSPWCERLRMDSFRTVDSGPIRGFICRTTPGGHKDKGKCQETSFLIQYTKWFQLIEKFFVKWPFLRFPFFFPLVLQSGSFWSQAYFSDFSQKNKRILFLPLSTLKNTVINHIYCHLTSLVSQSHGLLKAEVFHMRVSVVCHTRLSTFSLFYVQRFYSIQLCKYISCTYRFCEVLVVHSNSVSEGLVRCYCATEGVTS